MKILVINCACMVYYTPCMWTTDINMVMLIHSQYTYMYNIIWLCACALIACMHVYVVRIRMYAHSTSCFPSLHACIYHKFVRICRGDTYIYVHCAIGLPRRCTIAIAFTVKWKWITCSWTLTVLYSYRFSMSCHPWHAAVCELWCW